MTDRRQPPPRSAVPPRGRPAAPRQAPPAARRFGPPPTTAHRPVQNGRPAQPGRPVQGRPVQGRPVQGRPVQGRPVQGRPVQGRPVQGRPVQGRPVQARPAQARPAQSARVAPPRRPTQQRPSRPPQRRRRRRSLRLGALDGRLRYGFAAVCTLLLVIGGRLVQLQGLDHGGYAGAALAQRVDTLALHALRGQILDRNGVPLAYTSDAQDITADPQQVKIDDRLHYASVLSPLLGVPDAQIVTALSGKSQYAMLAQALSPAAAQRVTDLNLPGIYTQATTQRQYPAHTTGANVIGFVHDDGTGAAGIEQQYNAVLAGQDGSQTYLVDNVGNVNPSSRTSTRPARNGADVRLTLDQDLQFTAQRALDVAVPESGAKGAELAVLDAHTGQVLALASSGTFDASNPVLDPNTPMNPPVMSAFEPGSVQKAITFAAALQEKKITPQTTLDVPDSIDLGGVTVRDAWAHKTEKFTATGVLAESSNVGTLKIANLLGPTTWYGYEKRFGVGTATGIELPGESSGYVPPLSKWSASTFANLPFGQGESMTVLQLASIYQTFANNGVRIPPRIVSSVTKADGSVTTTPQPAGVRVIDAATAKTVRTMLESVTLPGGTGKKAAIPGYRVAGKTGTAQQPDPAHGGAYSSYKNWDTFAGMVPADDPQFVVAIMVDNPAHGVEGGDVAAPLFNQIASYELQHAAIPPTGSLSRHVPLQDCAGQDRRFLPANVC